MSDLVSSLTGRIRSSTQEMVFSAAIYGVVAIFALTTYVMLIYAAGLVISAEAGQLVAALSIAGATLLLALILLLVLRQRKRRLERLRELRMRSTVGAGSAAAMATLVPMMVRASPLGSLLGVAALAYVLSRAGQSHTHDKR